ncbi:MAG: glycosyltransferase, partial [Lachnospiraceae bacterium]|nr:glycosyltransferase [Lachnospiraceae bacterium]
MRILLYTGGQKLVEKSGVGKAISHQERALMLCGADITKNPKGAYDVLHVNTVFPDALWMAKRAKRQGKTVVYHAHSTMEDFRNSFIGSNLLAPLFKKWLCLCYNTADLVLTPTPYSRELLEGYGLKVPVKAISNGVDTEFFVKKPEQRKRFRETYGIRDEDPVVLSVGLPIERKGILDFIALAEQLPKVQFFWFGYASPALLPGRVKRAMKKHLPNLHFPGYVSKEQLRDAYGGSDLFLFLTKEETEGIVLLEALSMQIPVAVRDIPVYRDVFEDGVHLYKRKSPEEF